jgi:hypothetical protein
VCAPLVVVVAPGARLDHLDQVHSPATAEPEVTGTPRYWSHGRPWRSTDLPGPDIPVLAEAPAPDMRGCRGVTRVGGRLVPAASAPRGQVMLVRWSLVSRRGSSTDLSGKLGVPMAWSVAALVAGNRRSAGAPLLTRWRTGGALLLASEHHGVHMVAYMVV